MCGIVAAIGRHDLVPLLQDGLRALEYRGYDSAGIAVAGNGGLQSRRATGPLTGLAEKLRAEPLAGTTGIGHTRWATHGRPTEANAHPHLTERVALVHNGIVENWRELRCELTRAGCDFATDTDTEAVLLLADAALAEGHGPVAAARAAVERLRGTSAFVFAFRDWPDTLVAVRLGCPLAIGRVDGLTLIASDALALVPHTRAVTYLEEGDVAEITPEGVCITDSSRRRVDRPLHRATTEEVPVSPAPFRHFMAKEIHEQPGALGSFLARHLGADRSRVAPLTLPAGIDLGAPIDLLACGTANYAAMVAEHWIETLAGVPARAAIASEFRYRAHAGDSNGLAVFVSQSGETADTLAALRLCRERGRPTLAVVNAPDSSLAREADAVLEILAGPEIGVASTKAFTAQLTALACLAADLGVQRGVLDAGASAEIARALSDVPRLVAETLASEERFQMIAGTLTHAPLVLYVGRGTAHPLALEGALKLKEISYLHAEGYAAGELKHGPIALIDDRVVVVVLAPPDRVFEKTLSNMQEAIARGAQTVLISSRDRIGQAGDACTHCIAVPDCPELVAPIVYAPVVQLLSYHAAWQRGTDVDKPRNLAKSVTVE